MTASAVRYCTFCQAYHPADAFRPFRTGGYRGMCRAGEREEAARRGYKKPVKYPDGIRRYNCADCGKPCEVSPQAGLSTRCKECQHKRNLEVIKDFGARRVAQKKHEMYVIAKPAELARRQCDDRCPWWWFCTVVVNTGRALMCAPGSSGVPTPPAPMAEPLQSNWHLSDRC